MPKLCEPPEESWGRAWACVWAHGQRDLQEGRILGKWLGPEELMGNNLRVLTQMPEREAEERRVG